MITREDYLKAIETINQYNKQLEDLLDAENKSDTGNHWSYLNLSLATYNCVRRFEKQSGKIKTIRDFRNISISKMMNETKFFGETKAYELKRALEKNGVEMMP